MRCTKCNAEISLGERFCGECGHPVSAGVAPPSPSNESICPNCGAKQQSGERFCGECGTSVSTSRVTQSDPGGIDLFPLYGVTLGKTTVQELAHLGVKTSQINKKTGAPYEYYVIQGTNFWYDEAGAANQIYIAKGVYPMPEPWQALGFNWNNSYNEWISLLQRLGYSLTVEKPPHLAEYSGHDSFSARIGATKQKNIPIKLDLDFNYSEGTKTDSKGTLYYIRVTVP